VRLFTGTIKSKDGLTYTVPEGRYAWLQVASGIVSLNGGELRAGDGVGIGDAPTALELSSETDAQVLLFDLA